MTPDAARWVRPAPRSLSTEAIGRMVHAAFPHARVLRAALLAAGRRNGNFRLCLDAPAEPLVLRVYEHDASLCQKELDLLRLVAGAVPVHEVLHAAPRGLDDLPPFTLARFLEGVSFHDLKRSGDRDAIAQAARSAGETLAAIGRVRFPKAGWLGPGPAVGAPLLEGPDPFPRFLDLCLAHPAAVRRIPADMRARVHERVWRQAERLASLDADPRLLHGDFNRRNLLLRRTAGRWTVAAVLDWEFAVSGSPLADVGRFLRYERAEKPLAEPHFSEGFRAAGGGLPEDWRALAQWLDLAAVGESLTHEDLPETVERELIDLLMECPLLR